MIRPPQSSTAPLMADLFSGPHMPLGKAFLFCGWRVLPVDWLLDPDHDLSIPACQARVHEQLQDASFIAAALDCSTKSRAREIPRVFTECTGPRSHWLDFEPRSLREVPKRTSAASVAVDGKLPPMHVYVGQGNHATRLQATKWKCPWVVRVTCTHDEWIPLYVAHIHQNLWQDLLELQGSVLVCDCEDHTLCEADLLAGLVFDATSPTLTSRASPSLPHQRSTCSPTPLRKVLLTAALGVRGLPFEPPFILQESLALAFKRFYPEPWFQGFAFPFIEDLVNSFPLDLYSRWRFELGYPMEGSSAPHLASSRTRQRQRNAEGQQVGAISHRAALPPLIPFGLSPDEHPESPKLVNLLF